MSSDHLQLLFGKDRDRITMPLVNGFCDESFQDVKDLFTSNFVEGEDENAQLCVYVGNELVIDLWGCREKSNPDGYGPDSLQVVYSCGKNAAALIVGLMVDRGLLSYNEKVATYWPEFGINGKDQILLEDVLRHEGGLDFLEHAFADDDFTRENIKLNSVGQWLEKETAHWDDPVSSKRAYHTITRGWILNEIVRRVDPKSRTIGEIFHEDVMSKGMFCGLPEPEASLVMPQQSKSMAWLMGQTMLPSFLSDKVDTTLTDVLKGILTDASAGWQRTCKCVKDVNIAPDELPKYFQKDNVRRGEQPSASFNGSARGLASVAYIFANNGVDPQGKTVISKETCLKMHQHPKVALDTVIGWRTAFTQGGFNHFKKYDNPNQVEAFNTIREGWYGWQGYGGPVMQWHPQLKISFGYAQTNVRWYDRMNKIGGKLQKAVLDCLVARPIKE